MSFISTKKITNRLNNNLLAISKWCHQESNRGHKDFQSFALPSELWHLGFACAKIELFFIILLIFCHKNENDGDFGKKNAKI